MHVCMYVCMYIYIYVCMYIYIHTYILRFMTNVFNYKLCICSFLTNSSFRKKYMYSLLFAMNEYVFVLSAWLQTHTFLKKLILLNIAWTLTTNTSLCIHKDDPRPCIHNDVFVVTLLNLWLKIHCYVNITITKGHIFTQILSSKYFSATFSRLPFTHVPLAHQHPRIPRFLSLLVLIAHGICVGRCSDLVQARMAHKACPHLEVCSFNRAQITSWEHVWNVFVCPC